MTKNEIMQMAKKAGWEIDDSCVLEPQIIYYINQEQLERFAQIVATSKCKPLTKKNLCEILDVWDYKDETLLELCRRIEAAHGIKECL